MANDNKKLQRQLEAMAIRAHTAENLVGAILKTQDTQVDPAKVEQILANRNPLTPSELGYLMRSRYESSEAALRERDATIANLNSSRRNWRAATLLALLVGGVGGVVGAPYAAGLMAGESDAPVVEYVSDASQPLDAGVADAGDYIARSDLETECRSAGFSRKSSKKSRAPSCEDQGYVTKKEAKEAADARYVEATLEGNKKADARYAAGLAEGKKSAGNVDCTKDEAYISLRRDYEKCDRERPKWSASPNARFEITASELTEACQSFIYLKPGHEFAPTRDSFARRCRLKNE